MKNDKKKLTINNFLLSDIAVALNDNSYEFDWYLDTLNEETTFLCDPDITGEYEAHEKLERQIENDDEGRFIHIPRGTSRDGWKQMERFILSLDDQDDKIQNSLLNNIQGRGAFGRFKEAIYDLGLRERWFEFKGREDHKAALDWLHSLGLISDEDIGKGMQLYEEMVTKRKKRKEEIANMTKGVCVKCRNNVGHEDKLTAGKEYEALAEQKEHLNIKVRDDRGKVCWLPKSHFELT